MQATDSTSLNQAARSDPANAMPLREEVEEWFLRRGMPTAATSSTRFRHLLLRALPVFVGFTGLSLAITMVDLVLRQRNPRLFTDPDALFPDWYFFFLLGNLVFGIVLGALVNRHLRRWYPVSARTQTLAMVLPVIVVLLAVPDAMLGVAEEVWIEIVGNVVFVALVLLLIRLGIGAIFVWSLRQAAAQGLAIVPLAARALPMILLVTLFAFMSSGLWEVMGLLSRDELWNAVLILFAIAGVFAWAVIRDEMRSVMDSPQPGTRDILTMQFPAAERLGPVRLSRRESVNAVAILVFAFFCLFGAIAVPPSVVQIWTGHDTTTGSLMGSMLPIRNELVQASLFLAAFSSVSFAAASVTDPRYRQRFFDPLLQDVSVTIAARHLYRTSHDGTTRAD